MRIPLIIVIPAANQMTENTWMKENIDPMGGEHTFTSALSSDGANITHYWCSRPCDTATANALREHFALVYTGTPQEVLTNLGLQTIKEAV